MRDRVIERLVELVFGSYLYFCVACHLSLVACTLNTPKCRGGRN